MTRLRTLTVTVLVAALGALTPALAAGATSSPPDRVERRGPAATFTAVDVPGTTAMGAAPAALLREHGYAEQEFYVSGKACRYRITDPEATATVIDCGWDYRTRVLVRRPADPSRFNGTAVVEWNNVSTGQDIDFVWAATHDYQMRQGYAEVSLSAQLVGVGALQAWSPARYGSLSLSASNTDPRGGGSVDATGDVLSWDTLTQTVLGLRHPGAVDPLHGLPLRTVIATGESQSALRLTPYYNAIDPMFHAVEGVVYYDAAGPLRPDSPTKAISVATEIGVGLLPSGLPAPDSTHYRRWELAGTSHVSLEDMRYVDPMVLRDGYLKDASGAPSTLTGLITGCSQSPAWSTVPTGYVLDSALDHVNRWERDSDAPPRAGRLVRDPAAPPLFDPAALGGQAPGYATTSTGLTAGGIHLSEYDFSPALNRGAGTTGPATCWLTGKHQRLGPVQLQTRYPDRYRYLADATQLTAHNVARGYLLPDDARNSVRAAYAVFRDLGRH